MVALREEWSDKQRTERTPPPEPEGARWLSLRRASCSLNVCRSTLRRRMRKGELLWRVVNNGRRWSYEVLVPGGASPCAGAGAAPSAVSVEAHLRRQAEHKEREVARLNCYVEEKEQEIARLKCQLERQEQHIDNLAQALARARAPGPFSPDTSPFVRYRQLVIPRRRWWFF